MIYVGIDIASDKHDYYMIHDSLKHFLCLHNPTLVYEGALHNPIDCHRHRFQILCF